ncbi:gliding motility-associated C-terminal domain-containing protein [Halocola ammonii]
MRLKFTLLSALLFLPILLFAHNDPGIGFIENQNQFHENVRFQAQFNNYTVFLENNRFTFLLESAEDLHARHDIQKASQEEKEKFFVRAHTYRVSFLGANENVATEKESPHDYTLNYFLGSDESKWASGVRSYEKVRYLDLYEGIDLHAGIDEGNLKYDFVVNPGADPNSIVLDFEGLDNISIVDDELVLTTSLGEVRELQPYAYQNGLVGKRQVMCEYVLEGNRVWFNFPEGYDENTELVIDPVVIASTLSGTPGFSSNYGHGATFDLAGNIYSHAIAFGSQYPTTTGAMQTNSGGGSTDIAISKYNPTGTDLIYATYIGGNGGDYPHSTIASQFQELYVYGTTDSNDYPTAANAYDSDFNDNGSTFGQTDIVITKISADGTQMLGSTYVGGSAGDGRNNNSLNYGDVYRGEIVLDEFGFPYISSSSSSDDFPTTAGAYQTAHQGGQDAVVFKMNTDLSEMLWSTYLGSSNEDTGYGLRATDNGEVVVCGSTLGSDFPTTDGVYQNSMANADGTLDAFIARFSADGSQLLISTFVGTSETDQAFFIDLDNDEDVWIYGQSQGEWPTEGDVYSTDNGGLFVSKFTPDLDELLISSRIGPGTGFNGDAVPVAFLVDRCDRIYICGYNASSGFELTDDALYTTGGFVLCAWEEDMSELAFSTYYGGNHVDGGTSRFDKSGIVYQGVCSGGGFPTNADAWATGQEPGWDIGVFKIDFELSGVNAAITTEDDISGCAPHEVQFNNFSVGDQFEWDFGDGSPVSTEEEPTHTYTEPGEYTISLITTDSLSCNLADTAYLYIEIGSPESFQPEFTYEVDCQTQSIILNNETGADFLDYEWDMGDGTILTEESPEHTFDEPGVYNVVLTATDNACDNTEVAEAEIEILDALQADISNESVEACGEINVDFENLSNGQTYEWDFGDGATSDEVNPSHNFTGPGIFSVTLTAFNDETCNSTDTDTITIAVGAEQTIEAAFSVIQTDCEQFIIETQNESTGNFLSFDWQMGDGTSYPEEEEVEHQYDAIGNYAITLSIEDTLCSITDEVVLDVLVSNEVAANVQLDSAEGCPPFEVEFSNSMAVQESFWDFGDGTTSTDAAPVHIFETPGQYEVMLVVYGSESCPGQDTAYTSITVIDTEVEALFSSEQSGLCDDFMADFTNLSQGNNLNLSWNFNGTQVQNEEEYTHTFPAGGTYTVTLTATEPVCSVSDSYTEEVTIIEGFDMTIGPDRDICYYENSVMLDTGLDPEGMNFEWSTGDLDTPEIEVSTPGTYSVTVTDGTCIDQSEVEIGQGTEFEGAYSVEICEGVSNVIDIPAYGQSYQWETGQTTNEIYITRAGNYGYSFIDAGGCTQSDTVFVTALLPEASLYIPNAFTPDGDGVNEVFQVVGDEIERFEMRIYNRWGQVIFKTEDHTEVWDGSVNGGDHYVQDGLYSYMVTVKSTCKADEEVYYGNITVLR